MPYTQYATQLLGGRENISFSSYPSFILAVVAFWLPLTNFQLPWQPGERLYDLARMEVARAPITVEHLYSANFYTAGL